jgi:hypothetical protein
MGFVGAGLAKDPLQIPLTVAQNPPTPTSDLLF